MACGILMGTVSCVCAIASDFCSGFAKSKEKRVELLRNVVIDI